MKTTIEVEITNLEADEHCYSFQYFIRVNGKHKGGGKYEGDHSWKNDIKGLKKMLKDGEAAKLALEQEL